MGRQGPALRDQEHHAAEGRPRGDGEADARRAREARSGAAVGRWARRGHQRRRRREAAGDQGLGSKEAAEHQRSRGSGRGDPVGGDGHGGRHPSGGRSDEDSGRRGSHAAPHCRGIHQQVRRAGEDRYVDDRAGQRR